MPRGKFRVEECWIKIGESTGERQRRKRQAVPRTKVRGTRGELYARLLAAVDQQSGAGHCDQGAKTGKGPWGIDGYAFGARCLIEYPRHGGRCCGGRDGDRDQAEKVRIHWSVPFDWYQ